MVEKISEEVGKIPFLSDHLLFNEADVVLALNFNLDLCKLWGYELFKSILLRARLWYLSRSVILSLVGFPL